MAKAVGQTNSYERYLIQDSNLKAKYIRVTVNGNTENDWASISEIRAFSKPSSTDPGTDPGTGTGNQTDPGTGTGNQTDPGTGTGNQTDPRHR